MDEIIKYVTTNQFTVVAVLLAICLVVFIIFRKYFKLGLVIILLLCGLCGFFYIKDPDAAKAKISDAWKSVKEKTVNVTSSSSDAYTKGKEYIEKGRKAKEEAEQRIFDSPKEEKKTP
jgi:uncharacterized membrane protein